MADGLNKILPWVGVVVLGFGAASTSGVALFRIDAQAEEIQDISESVDENEEDIEAIQRLLIQRQGQVELDLQRIETMQNQQGMTLEEIKALLQQLNRNQ